MTNYLPFFSLFIMTVQAMKATKGFTLVELIVVITILAILATIGFLSLQGYTQDAKETKTVANLRTVASAMVNESAISGKSLSDYISSGSTARLAAGKINSGADLISADVTYIAGEINDMALKIDGTKFFDKDKDGNTEKFIAAAITFKESVGGRDRFRSMFQVAGTLTTATGETALVEGSYAKGATGDLAGIIKSTTATETPVVAGLADVPYTLK